MFISTPAPVEPSRSSPAMAIAGLVRVSSTSAAAAAIAVAATQNVISKQLKLPSTPSSVYTHAHLVEVFSVGKEHESKRKGGEAGGWEVEEGKASQSLQSGTLLNIPTVSEPRERESLRERYTYAKLPWWALVGRAGAGGRGEDGGWKGRGGGGTGGKIYGISARVGGSGEVLDGEELVEAEPGCRDNGRIDDDILTMLYPLGGVGGVGGNEKEETLLLHIRRALQREVPQRNEASLSERVLSLLRHSVSESAGLRAGRGIVRGVSAEISRGTAEFGGGVRGGKGDRGKRVTLKGSGCDYRNNGKRGGEVGRATVDSYSSSEGRHAWEGHTHRRTKEATETYAESCKETRGLHLRSHVGMHVGSVKIVKEGEKMTSRDHMQKASHKGWTGGWVALRHKSVLRAQSLLDSRRATTAVPSVEVERRVGDLSGTDYEGGLQHATTRCNTKMFHEGNM